jgi:hypothetical protein
MTTAKLSAGDENRDQMSLSGITDACRRHGALIISGHHHLYSRTKVLKGVGGPIGEEQIAIDDASDSVARIDEKDVPKIREGVTLSLTVGMGGYDSSCNGKYVDAFWMEKCVASHRDHRGAVVAEFHSHTPWTGTFKYMNSLDNAAVVDKFVLTSRLPGWNKTGTTKEMEEELSATESELQQIPLNRQM